MILVEYNKDKQVEFLNKLPYHIVGLQTDNGKFRCFYNQNFYFDLYKIDLKVFGVSAERNNFFFLCFRKKHYRSIYGTY